MQTSMNSKKGFVVYWQKVLAIFLPILLAILLAVPTEGASVSLRNPTSGNSGIAVVDLEEMIRNLQCVSGPCGATAFRCPSERCSYLYTYCAKAKRQTVCCC